MLKELMKQLRAEPKAAEVAEEVVELAVEVAPQVDAAAHEALVQEFEAFKAEANALVAQAEGDSAELISKLEGAWATITSLEAQIAEMNASALAAKLSARKEKVVAAIGTERADSLMAATEGLDDTAFDAVVSALVGKGEAEASSDLFKEVGVTAEVDASKVESETAEMKMLKAKYNKA